MPNNEILKELKYLINIGINEFVDDKPQKYYNPSEEKSDLPNQTEYTKLENIENLDDLKTAVINFQDCKLKFSAKNTIKNFVGYRHMPPTLNRKIMKNEPKIKMKMNMLLFP